ncbi:PREDICTED: uncharacterized protein LOC106101499 [Papilio polytes]|uniref:uncharacterized protein LOC106101499 n=1 Tax=Papilio polytes TaxID=76194 RepID=UPI00067663DA|nr:PREDICTED: uncharacterized protein LOC106101499 [Papilio polytes]
MFVEMPLVARCCFCAPLRYGLLIWAYLKLVTSVLALGITIMWVFLWLFFTLGETSLLLLILSTLISLIADVVFNFILIMGSHKKNRSLLCLYHRYAYAHAAIFLMLGVLWISYAIVENGKPLNKPDSVIYILCMVTSVIVPLILHIYLFIVLRSEIHKLEAKDQINFVNPINEYISGTEDLTTDNKTNEDN